jgi:hypothetical protein
MVTSSSIRDSADDSTSWEVSLKDKIYFLFVRPRQCGGNRFLGWDKKMCKFVFPISTKLYKKIKTFFLKLEHIFFNSVTFSEHKIFSAYFSC